MRLRMPCLRPSPRQWPLVAVAWSGLVGLGFLFLLEYGNEPGGDAHAPRRWPRESSLRENPDRPQLLLFAHPRCPCTRASVEELNRLLASASTAPDTVVSFLLAEDAPPGWERTDLWDSAARIPGVRVVADPGGREAALFGASTSGRVLLYSAAGELLFEGGLTASRGHAGDSAGRAALLDLLRGERPTTRETPTFGCALRASQGAARSSCPSP